MAEDRDFAHESPAILKHIRQQIRQKLFEFFKQIKASIAAVSVSTFAVYLIIL